MAEKTMKTKGFKRVKKAGETEGNKRTLVNQLLYSFHVIFHPFDGFWDLKHEKRGSRKSATVLVLIFFLSTVIISRFTGYLYRFYLDDGMYMDVVGDFLTIMGTFLLWCVANWALTTLMDGEGSFGDVYLVSAYALVPMILINVPLAFLSNIMPLELITFRTLFRNIAFGWTGFLLLCSMLVVHQYTMAKTVWTAIFIVLSMAFIIFLGLLFFNLIGQLMGFVSGLYWEIILRL